jgi:DNA-directed RNA polymerase subunit RPC12/RpoP
MALKTYSTSGPRCPYCGFQYTPDEPHYFDESNYTEEDCSDCGRTFSVSVYTSTSWTCEQRDVVGSPSQQGGKTP